MAASKVLENVEVVEVQISQEDNMFGCTKCDRSFKLYYHLKQHLKTHLSSLEKPHVCNHCGKAYTREGALKQHINTFHFDTEELSQNQKQQQKKVHVCEYCKKHFGHFGHFKEHLRKHTGEKINYVRLLTWLFLLILLFSWWMWLFVPCKVKNHMSVQIAMKNLRGTVPWSAIWQPVRMGLEPKKDERKSTNARWVCPLHGHQDFIVLCIQSLCIIYIKKQLHSFRNVHEHCVLT